MKKKISILGSTGSIGANALDVIKDHPDRFEVVGLAEGHDVDLLARQIDAFKPRLVSVRDEQSANKLREKLSGFIPEITFGIKGAGEVASMPEAEVVVSAIVGAAGLLPTIEAVKKGKTIALANKETMVAGGELVTGLAEKSGATILPVDSEHSAIFQSLAGHRKEDVSRLILTASGGPFLKLSPKDMAGVTKDEALNHPRWTMGAKITIDSATLMNKGLEVIEARWLFGFEPDKIEVLVHPQSIVHSLVEYKDGCVVAELGMPDMRAPIAYALSYPERVETKVEKLNLSQIGTLTFEPPDFEKFPSLGLAYEAIRAGRTYPVVLNAANEIAVEAFLEEKIKFTDISGLARQTMDRHEGVNCKSIEEILEADRWARETARNLIKNK